MIKEIMAMKIGKRCHTDYSDALWLVDSLSEGSNSLTDICKSYIILKNTEKSDKSIDQHGKMLLKKGRLQKWSYKLICAISYDIEKDQEGMWKM